MTQAYFKDMQIVDERLSTLENEVEELHRLLIDIQQILEATNGIKEEFNKGSERQEKL